MQGIADEEDFDFVLSDEARDGFEVGAKGSAPDRKQRLRGKAKCVGDCESDAAVADIEGERAGIRHRV